jgi:hypothetical protein
MADEQGVSALPIGHQWIVSCLSVTSPRLPNDYDTAITAWQDVQERAIAQARLNDARHPLRGKRPVDRVGASPRLAPLSIFPFDASLCARLMCDYVSFETVIGWDRVARALEEEGFAVECPLDEREEGAVPDQTPVLLVSNERGRLVIPGSGLHQILFEFVDPRTYAAALAEFFRTAGNRKIGFFFTFANESSVWR